MLLLRRATATRAIGRIDEATRDIDRAVELAASADPAVRRRVDIESAQARMDEGRREDAVRAAEQALVELGDGEGHTYARAYEVLAECATTSDARPDLQRAAECYRIAVAAWEACGELARARACRRDLALGVLVPLGRYDEALAQLGQLLGTTDLSDAERSMTMLYEGFVLLNANRLESAESRFVRATDIGLRPGQPAAGRRRGVGPGAGRRRGAVTCPARCAGSPAPRTRRSTDDDDVHGVPFLCDVATVLGALGELDLADRYLDRAIERRSVFPDQVTSTAFVLRGPQGRSSPTSTRRCAAPRRRTGGGSSWSPPTPRPASATSTAPASSPASPNASSSPSGSATAASLGEGRIQHELHTLLQRPSQVEQPAAPATRQAPDGG